MGTLMKAKVDSRCGPYGCCKWQTHGCKTAEGGCNRQCDWTQWSTDANPVCTCGPSSADWIKEDQCQACTVEDVVRSAVNSSVVAESKVDSQCGPYGCCKWQTHGCKTAEGGCNQQCDWTQWSSDSNPVCTCGPSGADWIKQDQCQACSVEAAVISKAKVESQ